MIWPFRRGPATRAVSRTASALPALSTPAAEPGLPPGSGFTPTQPRQGVRSLVGRAAELSRVLQALQDDQAHVVLYSERGRGKTSLVNAVIERLRQGGTVMARTSCQSDSTFDSIMRALVSSLPSSLRVDTLPEPAQPEHVAALPDRLGCRNLVFIVDEFDRVSDPGTAARMADTIKRLSDRGVPLRFVIVGVSENLEQMLVQHQSVQRNIAAVQLPLLRDADVAILLDQAATEAGAAISANVVDRVVTLTRGSPHLAQLMGLRLLQGAAAHGGGAATMDDFDHAVDVLLQEASPHDAGLWTGLTVNGTNAEMVQALRWLATAEQDEWGRLFAPATEDGGVQLGAHRIGPAAWSRIDAADVLRPVPAGSGLFIFRRRSALHYILMLATRLPDRAETKLEVRASAVCLVALRNPA